MEILNWPRGSGKTTVAALVTKNVPGAVMIVKDEREATRIRAKYGMTKEQVRSTYHWEPRGFESLKIVVDEIGLVAKLPYGLQIEDLTESGVNKVARHFSGEHCDTILATYTEQ